MGRGESNYRQIHDKVLCLNSLSLETAKCINSLLAHNSRAELGRESRIIKIHIFIFIESMSSLHCAVWNHQQWTTTWLLAASKPESSISLMHTRIAITKVEIEKSLTITGSLTPWMEKSISPTPNIIVYTYLGSAFLDSVLTWKLRIIEIHSNV